VTPAPDAFEAELGVDPETLLNRYRLERDRRLRPDGLAQFVDTAGRFAHFADDPWVEPGFSRAPLSDEVEVLVIGGGLGAILAGAELRKEGVEDVRFVERAGGFGGVWYWNRYPGAACDTQALLYLPMLEELGYLPRRTYASQPEILAHFQRIAERFDLYRDAVFRTEVTDVAWEQASARWRVRTDRGDLIRARFVVLPSGPMDRPKLPGIPGIETFGGRAFHTSRWDYGYTGGTAEGGLTGLSDKTVAVVGTGATAIQCIPYLAESAKHLYVFQRTPSSIDERGDTELDPEWLERQEPGWQTRLQENFTAIVSGTLTDVDLIGDGWTSVMANVRDLMVRKAARGEPVEHPNALLQLADFMKMNAIRDRVDAVVSEPTTADALKPWYNRFCKRPCFSDAYLEAFNRPNVTLVDTGGRGVDRITEEAIVVGERAFGVDCLIYSTGFEANAPFAKRITYPITGRDGLTLARKWEGGASTQHGIGTNGFPNLFIMSVVQTGLSLNFAHMIQEQARHVAHILGRAIRQSVTEIEVTREAEAAWVAEIDRAAIDVEAFQRACTPSYFNAEGDLGRMNRRNSPYGGGPMAFYDILAKWRATGVMPGLRLVRQGELLSRGDLVSLNIGAASSAPALQESLGIPIPEPRQP
jgi:cyclohexanone monooxygenase